jgi:hypothetical protein
MKDSLTVWVDQEDRMLDDPEKTSGLLAALKAAVPFQVALTPEMVLQLRGKQVAAVAAEQTVSDLSYAGDEGGIVCHLAPSDGGAAFFVSLTHVRVPHGPCRLPRPCCSTRSIA